MSRLQPVKLDIPIGVVTEATESGAGGRWFDCEKIRFRKGLPEKLGGWAIQSFGTSNGDADSNPSNSDFNGASANYSSGASTINMDSNVNVSDGDPVWLFGDSASGGLGTRSVSSGGDYGSFIPVLDGNVTATAGYVVMFQMAEEFAGTPATITSDGLEDDTSITIDTAVTTYLRAGTVVTIALQAGGNHHTTLSEAVSSGATTLPLSDPLPSDATLASSVQVWAAGSEYIDFANDVSYIFRLLAHNVSTSTQLILTEALPEDVGTAGIDIRPYQETTADGDQAASATLDIADTTDFAITANATFPDGFVVLPSYLSVEDRFLGTCRALHDWSDLEGQQWAAVGTDKKLYVVNNDTLFDITPLRSDATLTDPFDTTALSVTITVTHASHGAAAGDYVSFTGASAVGGITIDGEYEIQSIVDNDSYTISAAYPALTTGSGGGSVSVEYDIHAGYSTNQTLTGYGAGSFGEGVYGVGSQSSGITDPLRIWSLDNYGEDLLASPVGRTLYHWDRSSGPTVRAVQVDEAPPTIQRMIVSPQARHVIALGAGSGDALEPGSPDRLKIDWCSSEDFTSWVATSTNTAGGIRLDVGSKIITAIESRGDIVVWTDQSMHALAYIGGDNVFGLRHLGQSVTIIGPNAAVDVNGRIHFMAQDDFMKYDGVIDVLPCDVRNHVFDDLNLDLGYMAFAAVNKKFNEIWWFYPSASATENDRYVKLNYAAMVWDFGTIVRTAFHDSSPLLINLPYGTEEGRLFKHESGVDETDTRGVTQPMVSYLESGDSQADEGGSRALVTRAAIPDFKTLTGTVELTLVGKEGPQSSNSVTKGPFSITSSTSRQGVKMRARQISLKVRSDRIGDDWRMGAWRIEARPKGKRGAG